MKKLLLSCAALVLAANISELKAQGATCEEATAMPTYVDGSTIPNGAWYNYSVTEASMFPSSAPVGLEDGNILIYEGCGGRSAIKMSTNTYYLEPGKEYKVFLKLRSSDFFFPSATSMANAPAGMYCVKPIVIDGNGLGIAQSIGGARTMWYQIEPAINAPLKVVSSDIGTPLSPNVTKVVTKHLACDGGTNESNELLPQQTYVKAGVNLVGVTTDAKCSIMFQLDGVSAAGCGNNPAYAPVIELNTESAIANAYYVVNRRFVVPEDGNYTFTLNAAEGSILSIASVVVNENNKKVCDFDTNPLSVEVGENNTASVVGTFKKDDIVILYADESGVLADGTPSLKVVKGGTPSTGINNVKSSSRDLKLSENPTDGLFTITSTLLKNGAEIGIYDMSARRVWASQAKAGSDSFDVDASNLVPGTYLVVVYGPDRSASAKLIVK